MTPNRLSWFFALTFITCGLAASVSATEPLRIWVDVSGRFSIKARLLELNDDSVLLLQTTGESVSIARDKLSKRDGKYLEAVEEALKGAPNALRLQPPKLPDVAALPILDLPTATHEVEDGTTLVLEQSHVDTLLQPPGILQPDASPLSTAFPEARLRLPRLGSYDIVSRAIPVTAPKAGSASGAEKEDAKIRTDSIGISIASGLTRPGQTAKGRLMRFDADAKKQVVVWQGVDNIRLFDHHLPSGRSLVLIGYSPVGHGGQLAMATGWDSEPGPDGNAIQISHRRSLPAAQQIGRLQHARWARWIDEEHVVVMLNRSLVAWNLISGEQLFRIDNVVEKTAASLSSGRRYLAVSGMGYVDVYRTSDGKSLGRIPVDGHSVPATSFAPRGDALALATSRRLRVWDLTSASLRSDVMSRHSLGKDAPVWIGDDLLMSSSGVLISQFRGIPVWRYELTGCKSVSCSSDVAVIRKYPEPELSIVRLPHPGAIEAMNLIDSSPRPAKIDEWRIPGRSVWTDGEWTDRDVRLSSLPPLFR